MDLHPENPLFDAIPFFDVDDGELQESAPVASRTTSDLRARCVARELFSNLPYTNGKGIEVTGPRFKGNYIEDASYDFNFVTAALLRKAKEKQVAVSKGALSLLKELPLELILEIFSYLTPLDLFHLSRVCRVYRKLLLDPSTSSLWATVWGNDGITVPHPPPEMKYTTWASFLFGSTLCWECKTEYGAPPDFVTMKRLCYNCLSTAYTLPLEVGIHDEHDLSNSMYYTCWFDEWMDRIGNHRGNWEGLWVHRESSKRLLEQYKKLQEAVLVNPGGLEENAAYDAFMKERNEKQTELIMFAEPRTDWLIKCFEDYKTIKKGDRKAYLHRIRCKLYKAGYKREELRRIGSNLLSKWLDWGVIRVTNRFIKRQWPSILELAKRSKKAYHKAQREKQQAMRRIQLCKAYRDFRRSFKAEQWHALPSDEEVLAMGPCSRLLDMPTSYTVSKGECEDAIKKVELAVVTWFLGRRRAVLRELHDAGCGIEEEEQMNLATAIFNCTGCWRKPTKTNRASNLEFNYNRECCSEYSDSDDGAGDGGDGDEEDITDEEDNGRGDHDNDDDKNDEVEMEENFYVDYPDEYDSDVEEVKNEKKEEEEEEEDIEPPFDPDLCDERYLAGSCLITGDELWNHLNCSPMFQGKNKVVPFATGRKFVRHLLSVLGLDIERTSARKLDLLDPRIACMFCRETATGFAGWRGRRVFSWRDYVRHLTWRGCAGHLTWRLTTPRVADYVRNKSGRIKWSRDPAWACNHCPEHLDNMATYRDVFQHVEDEHSDKFNDLGHLYPSVLDRDFIHYPRYILNSSEDPVIPPDEPKNIQCLRCQQGKLARFFSEDSVKAHLNDKHLIAAKDAKQDVHWMCVPLFTTSEDYNTARFEASF